LRHACCVRPRRMRAAGTMAFCLVMLSLFAPLAPAYGAPRITVEGNRRVEADTIRSYFQVASGEALDPVKIDAAIKALYASGLFKDVAIERTADGLTVRVVEAPVIDRIQFEGNKSLKDKQLTSEVQSKPRGTLTPAQVQADVARIAELYRHSGRFNARIEPKIIEHGENRVDLIFEISEGEKTTVRRIAFVGNRAYSARQLKDAIKTSETGLLSFLSGNDIYDADRVEADRDLLRRFYLKRGYADARIVSAQAQFDAALKGIVVTFTIDEGEPYRFGTIDIDSHVPELDGHSLANRLLMRTGDVYNKEAIDKTIDDLTITLAKRGYPFGTVRARSGRNADGKLIDLVFSIEEGPRNYVERINIRGNRITRDYVIRREFDISEGDAYNRALIDRAERRLKALDYFKEVKITTEPGSAPDRVVVNVDVKEQQTGELSFGGGYSTTDGIVGNVSIGDRNFFGRGEAAKLSVTYGQYAKSGDLSFTEPYIFGTPMWFSADIFGKETSANSYQSYSSETYGVGFKLGMPLSETMSAQLRYSIYNQGISLDPSGTTPVSLPIQQAAQMGPAWVSLVGYTLSYDTVDNKKNPTEGIHADLKQDVAGLGGDVNFVRTAEDVHYYHEIAEDVVGTARLQSGYITPWGGQDLPLIDRFFGGPQLVRGFAPNGFGPRDLTPGTTMDNIGGTAYWATTAEVQTGIPYLPSEMGLKFAVFADAGNVWVPGGQANIPALSQSLTGNSSVIRSSFGAGLIWASPFGPIRVDYAYPVTKTGYDVTQRLHFGYGGF
jgi:outer membrane protein insertion porin family